jgi:hypothetical protein
VLLTVSGGRNHITKRLMEVEEIAPGIGRVPCLECEGRPEEYPSLFAPEIGVSHCMECKGLGYVLINI